MGNRRRIPSRNIHWSTRGGQGGWRGGAVQTPAAVSSECEIDFEPEKIVLTDTEETYTFRYKGATADSRFGMYFYSHDPGDDLENPNRMYNNLPTVTFEPATPVRHTGYWRDASFTISPSTRRGTLYVILFMYD